MDAPNPGRRNDETTTVRELRDVVERFVSERNWQSFHNPKNLSMSLAIEAAELMEHFQWTSLEESGSASMRRDPQRLHDVGEELADCLAYVIAMANVLQIDLTRTLEDKMVRNAQKYPPP